ncbi:DUF4349 domain-containing protein [Nannocystis bainbridge]|uniref:DUF4349 domain-containing protein n=1 Tax=Nannocystis bainbridge TaxID=2995303 RepID=A0ABT5DV14_9BACT|nr:DUF4349 domain-containing protein [Nannocystis bainbridge]MDC0717479.1 DUF4349 domain-containing protein [Nannocystis bainbridge]
MDASWGGGGAMADGDVAAPEMAPMPAEADGSIDFKRDEAMTKSIAPTTSLSAPAPARGPVAGPPEPRPASTPTVSGGQGEDKEKEPQKQFARQIVYTADMAISCFKLDEAMQRAEALTLESGGYVQTMSQGYFVLRIPAVQLRRVMEELGKLGVVEGRNLQAQDVTQEFVDLTTRIRVLRETQSQVLLLLKQARNVQEALDVRRSLDAITLELETALGRLRLLENQIDFSTLTVRMSERGPQNAVPSSNDPFPWVDTLGVEATEWN